ncbi:MAG: DNA methyltransferase [Bacteroidales bacterium]
MAEEITCLGKTFNNEEERREYFRNELRKKLPELKKIDGFPIGEDEDIIALSDPPYYTACPNPWLNDIIDNWEIEKDFLRSENKRDENNIPNYPYAIDVSEGKNNPIYNAHSYHTKVPHPAIMRYILHYTQPGDIIFDGFAGTGMTCVAAQLCANPDKETKIKIEKEWSATFNNSPNWGLRKSICSDLSPIASFLADKFSSTESIEKFDSACNKLLSDFRDQLGDLYYVNYKHSRCEINYVLYSDVYLCPNCNEDIVYWGQIFDYANNSDYENIRCLKCETSSRPKNLERKFTTVFDEFLKETIRIKKTVPVQVNLKYRRKNINVNLEDLDEDYLGKISNIKVNNFFPISRMPEGDEARRNDRTGITHIHHFYSRENLKAISNLYDVCRKDKYTFFGFFNTAWHGTLMRRYNSGGGHRPKSGTLYIPSVSSVGNIFNIYQNKLSQLRRFLFETKDFKISDRVIFTSSANSLLIKSSSVDYIFTDPPFGANIMYSELSYIWEHWLKLLTNNTKEAIENKTQGKGKLEYQNLMIECFSEFYRILKPNKWMTVEFSNPSAAIWNSIQTALQKAGFIIGNVSALDKKQGSINAYTTPTAVKQDLVISCYKPSSVTIKNLKEQSLDISIWEFVEEYLNHLPIHINVSGKTSSIIERSPRILFDKLVTFCIMKGISIPIDSITFQSELKKRFVEKDGMYFTNEQVMIYENKKATAPFVVQLKWQVATENEGIEWLKRELNNSFLKYQDIQPKWMQAITAIRKGDILPELSNILEQNFIQEPDGSWRVPNLNESKDRDIIREKALLKEFNTYIELANNPKSKRMKEVRVEALRAGFKHCWDVKDFQTIIEISNKIPQNLLLEDEQLLMYYDIAKDRM